MRSLLKMLTVGVLAGVVTGVVLNLTETGQTLAALLIVVSVLFAFGVAGAKKAEK